MTRLNGLSLPTARPDGLVAACLLSFLGTAGLFYVNIMAAIVDGLESALGFSDAQAGNVAAANIYGAAAGAFTAMLLVKRLRWRVASAVLLVALIAIDLASMEVHSPHVMVAIRLLHGFAGGLLVGISYAVVARTAKPDRTFGVMLFVQFGLGGLGILVLPRLVPVYGAQSLFAALALFSLTALAMLPFLAAYPPREPVRGQVGQAIEWRPLVLTQLAIFLFQCANMALLAYMIRLGIAYGLERDAVSMALGLATWVALAGPALVVLVETRFGRFGPLLAGMVLTLGGMYAFHWSGNLGVFLIANCATGITWGLVMAYLLGMASQFDESGRTAAAAGFLSKMGLASGPLIAGQMLARGASYGLVIDAAIVLLALSMVVMLVPAYLLDRRARDASLAPD